MANFDTVTKVIIGDANPGETSADAGSFAKTVNDYIETIDDAKLVSISTSFQPTHNAGKHKLAAVIVTKV